MESSLKIKRILNGPFGAVGLGQVAFNLNCHPTAFLCFLKLD